VVLQAALVDGGAAAVVRRGVGVRPQMHRRTQRREGDVVAALEVEQHLARRRHVTGPDLQARADQRRDVVQHGPSSGDGIAIAPANRYSGRRRPRPPSRVSDMRLLLLCVTLSLVLSASAWAQSDDWKFDVIHRKVGQPLSGLVTEQDSKSVTIRCVSRKRGSPTVVFTEVIPQAEIDKVVLLPDKERKLLQ